MGHLSGRKAYLRGSMPRLKDDESYHPVIMICCDADLKRMMGDILVPKPRALVL